MKGPQIKKALSMLALGLTLTVFGANQSCDINVQDGSSDPYWLFEEDDGDNDRREDRDEDDEDGEDREIADYDLAITGSGEILTLSAGHASFAARINWDTGQYFFAPDPEGEVTGDRIICSMLIDGDFLQGECFRQRHVCDFFYTNESSENGPAGTYSLDFTSCLDGGEQIGPFLVPLESPLCGEDPFPACPADDLFPSGVTEGVSSEDANDPEETE